ncbi:MAG: ATP-binding protein [Anaerolineaceae bacterium]|nr:ATP-binding protein [Anaerolineaceae bacterium]
MSPESGTEISQENNDSNINHLLPSQSSNIACFCPGHKIGSLIAIETMRSPNYLIQHFRIAADVPSPKSGVMVAVESITSENEKCYILARVSNVWEINPHEDATSSVMRDVLPIQTEYASEGSSTVIYRVAEIEPLEEAVINTDGQMTIRNAQTLPRAGSPIYVADDFLIQEALGLEPTPNEGIFIGMTRGQPPVSVYLKKNIIQRHIFIGGGIGSGKSYTRGVLAEELHMLGVPQINIDVNGEMVDATTQLGGENLVPGKNGFTLPLSALTGDDVVDAIPGMRRGTNYEALIRYAHEKLLKERTLEKGLQFGVPDLIKKIRDVAPELEMDKAVTINPAVQRASSLEYIPYIGAPFEWKSHIKPGAIINIDCRRMLVSDLRLIVASIARDLQRLASQKDNLFVVFSIDEFHLVAPNDDSSVTTQVLREIARIGRHYKIGLILTTQSPQDVDRAILKRLLTRFLHAIEPDQLDALRGVFSDASEDLIKQLPKLPQGTCILTGSYETIRHATVIQVRERLTVHGGQTPDIWKDFVKLGWDGKRRVDL